LAILPPADFAAIQPVKPSKGDTMKKIHALCATAALLGGLFTVGQAQAADTPGVYLLAAGGSSKYDTDCAGTTKCDNTGSAFKFVGGYRLGNGIAIEGVSYNFGKAEYADLGLSLELKATAVGGGVAVYGELSPNWLVTARLGIASVKMKGVVPNVGSTSDSSTNPYVGVAVAYHFTPTVSAEVGYDSTKGKVAGESGTISAFTLGIGIKF
jgi:Outer membrane protein beta-barrel domain